MSDIRISDTQSQLANLNLKLERALQAARRAQSAVGGVRRNLSTANPLTQTNPLTNPLAGTNLNLTWTGSSLTVSWPIAYIQNSAGINLFTPPLNSVKNFAIPAGSKVLVASTTYTVFWNPIHSQLVFSMPANVVALSNNHENINICTITTGTSGDSGWVGGAGGSPQGYGNLGQVYTNF